MKPPSSPDPADLRRAAEARLQQRRATTGPRTGTDLARLQQELEVHQTELEMQNESLLKSQAELEAALEGYTDLYDFAPVGYLTLGPAGGIQQANLAAAKMLGVERSRLVSRRLRQFVCPADRAALDICLQSVFEEGGGARVLRSNPGERRRAAISRAPRGGGHAVRAGMPRGPERHLRPQT